MSRSKSERKPERLRGVIELPTILGEPRFRAWLGRGKGQQANLGVYANRWAAAFAYNVAAQSLFGERRPSNEIPEGEQLSADEVRAITARVRLRLGLDKPPGHRPQRPPSFDEVRTLFEITVIGFWRQQVAAHADDPARELSLAAQRLVEAARLLFWNRSANDPNPLEVMEEILSLRLDRTFRRAEITRAVLEDDADDALRLARWLVYPDALPTGPGFREAVARVHADRLGNQGDEAGSTFNPGWATVLGLAPPFSPERIRDAYRNKSKTMHPDVGGSPAEFIRLRAAYEEALRFLASRQASS